MVGVEAADEDGIDIVGAKAGFPSRRAPLGRSRTGSSLVEQEMS